MSLSYLLDEHYRGDLWRAILSHNAFSADPIDAIRVGDPSDLPLSTPDHEILRWAESAGRVLISRDRRTMNFGILGTPKSRPQFPCLFIVGARTSLADLLAFLAAAAHAGDDDQWKDQVTFIP